MNAKEPGTDTFWDDSLKLDDVLRLLDGARSAAKFVIFDACRNELQLPTKDTSKGLIPVAEQEGLFVAYASSPGRTASDRGDKSGVYAAALAAELLRPGLDHLNLFQNVKEVVLASTNGVQQPWESNGLSRRVYLTGQPNLDPALAPRVSEATEAWDRTKDTKDIAVLEAFASRYNDTIYARLATARIEALQKKSALLRPSHLETETSIASEERIRAQAARQGIPLPPEIVISAPDAPDPGIPAELAAYVGAWGGDGRWNGVGRQLIIVVTYISSSGEADGFHCNGPPNPHTYDQKPAGCGAFVGSLNHDGLQYVAAGFKFRFLRGKDNTMIGYLRNPKGGAGSIKIHRIE